MSFLNSVSAENLIHTYFLNGAQCRSLNGVSFDIKKGEFISVLGENGSGKTTLARHLNMLILLQSGRLRVAGLDVSDKNAVQKIRSKCAMVFQNPDNQFVSSLVEEDLAFGPQNFGVSEEETALRIKAALEAVGMNGYEKKSVYSLSGGQKQRIAIAGVLAIQPNIILFDESTAMLDPNSRQEILSVIQKLHSMGHTVIMTTHYVEEAVYSDRIILLKNGTVLAEGTPYDILTDINLLNRAGIRPPMAVSVYYELEKRGIKLQRCPLTNKELAGELCALN